MYTCCSPLTVSDDDKLSLHWPHNSPPVPSPPSHRRARARVLVAKSGKPSEGVRPSKEPRRNRKEPPDGGTSKEPTKEPTDYSQYGLNRLNASSSNTSLSHSTRTSWSHPTTLLTQTLLFGRETVSVRERTMTNVSSSPNIVL